MTFSPLSGRTGTVRGMADSPSPAVPEEPCSGAGPAFHDDDDRSPLPASAQWPLRSCLELGAPASAVPCARLHARLVLWEWGIDHLADTVELIVSELVTNGIRASEGLSGSWFDGEWAPGTPPVRLWLFSDRQCVLVRVWDGNEVLPEQRILDEDSESGRGLCIVEAVSEKYGVFVLDGGNGKIVWARIVQR